MKKIGITKKKLKIIDNINGSIMHALKKSDFEFKSFGEVYFSNINYKSIKAWKRHTYMTMNLVVPIGLVRFVFFDQELGKFEEYAIGPDNYYLLNVDPLIWFGFQGLNKGENLVMNFANIEHDPNEVERKSFSDLIYNW